jgi:hypothetical protein
VLVKSSKGERRTEETFDVELMLEMNAQPHDSEGKLATNCKVAIALIIIPSF